MRPERICLPLAQWPARDRMLWIDGTQAGSLFDAPGAGSAWSPQSRRKAASGYGRWLAWLMRLDELDPTAPPGLRVTPERVKAFLDHLEQTVAPYSRLCRAQELYDALRVLAPDQDRAWLARICRTLRARAKPAREKRHRLKPADTLADLGFRLMKEAELTPGWSPRRRAVLYRDGLMIALPPIGRCASRTSPPCAWGSISWSSVGATGSCLLPPRPRAMCPTRRWSRRLWRPRWRAT